MQHSSGIYQAEEQIIQWNFINMFLSPKEIQEKVLKKIEEKKKK